MEVEAESALFGFVHALDILPTAWENKPNRGIENSNAYIALSLLPIDPDVRGVTNGWSVYRFILQCSIAIKENKGTAPVSRYVDQLREAMPFNKHIQSQNYTFQTTRRGDRKAAFTVNSRFITPVHFRFQTIA